MPEEDYIADEARKFGLAAAFAFFCFPAALRFFENRRPIK
jgi:hypothetical protein